ncbi:MAG: nitroreductase family protein [Lentisphaeria bacterium]|nr:nitroreductase family protein [Lentisphaeria bacterium]
MKKILCGFIAGVCVLTAVDAAAENVIKLPTPNLKSNVSLKSALEKRKTSRTFSNKALSELDLSNLLWAAYGQNRPNGKRTVPVARGIYAIEMYVALSDGVYKHELGDNVLKKVTSQDMRAESDSRKMGAKAPVVLVMVADGDAFNGKGSHYIAMEAGAIMQNIYLYCAGYNLNTVVCGSFKPQIWAKALKLPANKYVILTQVVGCPR